MKPIYFQASSGVLIIAVVLAVLISGCMEKISPEDVKERALKSSEEVKSYSLEGVIETKIQNESFKTTIKGSFDTANRTAHTITEKDNTKMESYAANNSVITISCSERGCGQGREDYSMGGYRDLFQRYLNLYKGSVELLENAAKIDIDGEEAINGEICYVVKLLPDKVKFLEYLRKNNIDDAFYVFGTKEYEINAAKIWVSKKTFYVLKFYAEIKTSIEIEERKNVTIQIDINLCDHNKQLTIQLPEEIFHECEPEMSIEPFNISDIMPSYPILNTPARTLYAQDENLSLLQSIGENFSKTYRYLLTMHMIQGNGNCYGVNMTDMITTYNITAHVKKEKIGENMSIVAESDINLPEEELKYRMSDISPSSYLAESLFPHCPPECEKEEIGWGLGNSIEYIDASTGSIRIISIPWGTKFKMDNTSVHKKIYERSELLNNNKLEKVYNFTSYMGYNGDELREIFDGIFYSVGPPYVPGFIDFVPDNISAVRFEELASRDCGEYNGGNSRQIYNCTDTYNITYIKKDKNDNVIMIKQSDRSEQLYSSTNTTFSPQNVMSINGKVPLVIENLSFVGIEDFGKRKAYRIEYTVTSYGIVTLSNLTEANKTYKDGTYKDEVHADRWTIWIDRDDKILLGAKREVKLRECCGREIFLPVQECKLIEE